MGQEKIYYCIGCGKTHNRGEFYKSYNSQHKNGVYPFCKEYIKKEVYRKDGSINVEKFKNLLMQMDAPFLRDEFEGALEEKSETIGRYFVRIAMVQNRGLTWKDSTSNNKENEKQENKNINENNNIHPFELTEKETRELEDKWGFGYSSEELYLFEKKYQMLKNNYLEKTAMHSEALYNYIRYRVKEEMATAEGNVKEAKDWGGLAKDAANAAKINPSQLSKSDLTDGLNSVGEIVRATEQAVDIIEILPKFKEKPQDKVDFTLWCYINYVRDLKGLPSANYEDIYQFYEERKKEYEERLAELGEDSIFDSDGDK